MNRVIHFEIQADDINRASDFYKKVFGWEVSQMMKKEETGMDYFGITTGKDCAGINGGMYQRPMIGVENLYTYDCTIDVEDIDKAMELVKQNGGTITREKMKIPNVGLFCGCKDTEGNRFGLIQPMGWIPKI